MRINKIYQTMLKVTYCMLILIFNCLVAKDSPKSNKWNTVGLQQANTMGAGQATLTVGKLRIFILMGQSNMHGAANAKELSPPYSQQHDRILIWANGRWKSFTPKNVLVPAYQWLID